MAYNPDYAQYIDHTILKIDAGKETLKRFCDEAKQYHFASVCVNPCNVSYVAGQLEGSGVKVAAVVGFPLGANTSYIKSEEAKEAIRNGADEIDMVMNVAALKDGDLDYVLSDMTAVIQACHPDACVKVILETAILTPEEITTASRLAAQAGADFVKTSTGFAGGATLEAVRLMKAAVGDRCRIKASTGINNREICDAFLAEGVSRFGTSKGIKIVEGTD